MKNNIKEMDQLPINFESNAELKQVSRILCKIAWNKY